MKLATASPEELKTLFPLPAGWSDPEIYPEEFLLGESKLFLVGMLSRRTAQEIVTGSAADFASPPWSRAYFELLERISVLHAESDPKKLWKLTNSSGKQITERTWEELSPPGSGISRASRSNGVALGLTWKEARERATLELIERDRVLSSWFGRCDPIPHPLPKDVFPAAWQEAYEFELYSFPSHEGNDDSFVMGAFCFPKNPAHPRGYGFGAHHDEKEAIGHALRECAQAVGFLWGEDIPQNEIPFSATPDYHQDFYLQPKNVQTLKKWLHSGHKRFLQSEIERPASETLFVDLTPPELVGQIAVVKAFNPQKIPLIFGVHEPLVPAGFPWELRVHPVA